MPRELQCPPTGPIEEFPRLDLVGGFCFARRRGLSPDGMLAAARLEEKLEVHRYAFGMRNGNSEEMLYVVGLRGHTFLELSMFKGNGGDEFWEGTIKLPDGMECPLTEFRGTSCEEHSHAFAIHLDSQHHAMFNTAQRGESVNNGNLLRAVTGMVIGQMIYSKTEGSGQWIRAEQVELMQQIVLCGNYLGNRTMMLFPSIREFFELEAAIAAEELLDAE